MSNMKAKAAEVGFAQAFLKQLGGDYNNIYLITAVVAWMRQESGGLSKVIGNNPFNLRPGRDDLRFRSGTRKSKNGNGFFSVYASLAKGAQAAANRLISAGSDYRGYNDIVSAARGNYSKQPGDQALQARDFLKAIAMSKWNASHYGALDITGPPDERHYGEEYHEDANHLIMLWRKFTGLTFPAVKNPMPKPPRNRPKPQKSLIMALPLGNYIKPYAARTFFEQRHPVVAPLPSGIV